MRVCSERTAVDMGAMITRILEDVEANWVRFSNGSNSDEQMFINESRRARQGETLCDRFIVNFVNF